MPEEKKKKIVIASVLKPVDDTRMAEKIGATLTELNQVEVFVIGYPTSTKTSLFKTIELNRFNRLSLKRMFAAWKVLAHVLRIHPKIFTITTHELLFIALVARIFTGCKLIYDVQENYYRNIKFTKTFPVGIRHLVAFYVRAKEVITSPFFSHYFLAEQSYVHELNFISGKFTVIENKVIRPAAISVEHRDPNALLFSGTLAESTGVFVAIKLADKLHEIDPRFTLTIIGFCAQTSELIKLKQELQTRPFVQLIGGNELVPHSQIIDQIKKCGAGIIAYPHNPSTATAIPTKLYEYLGYQLPILLIRNPLWEAVCAPLHAAHPFDPESIAPRGIIQFLQNQQFYNQLPDSVYWDFEARKLHAIVRRFL
jgi:glycosyltransferase involved in cell wall biosynthesis